MLGMADYTSNMSTLTQMPTMINCICSAFIFLFAFIAYQRYLINGSLSSYVDTETVTPTNNTDITSNTIPTNDTTTNVIPIVLSYQYQILCLIKPLSLLTSFEML